MKTNVNLKPGKCFCCNFPYSGQLVFVRSSWYESGMLEHVEKCNEDGQYKDWNCLSPNFCWQNNSFLPNQVCCSLLICSLQTGIRHAWDDRFYPWCQPLGPVCVSSVVLLVWTGLPVCIQSVDASKQHHINFFFEHIKGEDTVYVSDSRAWDMRPLDSVIWSEQHQQVEL